MRISIVLLAFAFASATARAADDVILFNGKDFTGWTFYLEQKDYNPGGKGKISDFATVKPGGVIEITPKLHGALMTEKDYLNYKIHVEWRWVDPAEVANMPTTPGLAEIVESAVAQLKAAEMTPAIFPTA